MGDLRKTPGTMTLPPGRWFVFLLLFVLPRVSFHASMSEVECGDHQIDVGQILTIKGSHKQCIWNFQGPENAKVKATCLKFVVPSSKKCKSSSLDVASPGSSTVSFCGRKSRMTIDRSSSQVTFTNRPSSGSPNRFTCDIYLVMPTSVPANCSCGAENPPVSRIVGGTTTSPGQYPWVGAITFTGMKRPFCSLTLLTDTHALTAAHCLDGKKRSKLIAVLAEHKIGDLNDTPRTIRRIKKIAFHPKHRPDRVNVGDLAVMTFDYPVPLDHSLIKPACLP
ncbi:venom serine protease 34-like isoform X2 [Macrobrachium rosenbergii]|uniref:venom serine protease 34-like isoform X2 n=1 Tax=Macrobrachium rosenbergii TaxID=79674 RepID=UPI0034D4050C